MKTVITYVAISAMGSYDMECHNNIIFTSIEVHSTEKCTKNVLISGQIVLSYLDLMHSVSVKLRNAQVCVDSIEHYVANCDSNYDQVMFACNIMLQTHANITV